MYKLKIGTYNVRGLRDATKRLEVFNFIRQKQFDIVMLQEVHSIQEDEAFWTTQWGGSIIFSHGTSTSQGIATLIAKNSGIKLIKSQTVIQGRLHELHIEINEQRLQVLNIYTPNQDDPDFFETVGNILSTNTLNAKIVGGDLNLCLDSQINMAELVRCHI